MCLRGQLAWGDEDVRMPGLWLRWGLERPPGEDGQEAWDEGWRGKLGWTGPWGLCQTGDSENCSAEGKGPRGDPEENLPLGQGEEGKQRGGRPCSLQPLDSPALDAHGAACTHQLQNAGL